jgi:hypothetical protein
MLDHAFQGNTTEEVLNNIIWARHAPIRGKWTDPLCAHDVASSLHVANHLCLSMSMHTNMHMHMDACMCMRMDVDMYVHGHVHVHMLMCLQCVCCMGSDSLRRAVCTHSVRLHSPRRCYMLKSMLTLASERRPSGVVPLFISTPAHALYPHCAGPRLLRVLACCIFVSTDLCRLRFVCPPCASD